jgi:hypothetical protein
MKNMISAHTRDFCQKMAIIYQNLAESSSGKSPVELHNKIGKERKTAS